MGFFDKIKQGLTRTKENMTARLNSTIASFTGENEDFFEELEETLILSDVGAEASMEAVDRLRDTVEERGLRGPEEVRAALKEILVDMLGKNPGMKLDSRPSVILVVGVNGVGKTTTIGKLARLYEGQGKRYCWPPETPSGPPPRSSLACGLSARGPTLCAMRRGLTPPPWSLTASPPPSPGVRRSSSWTPPAGSTTSRT